LAGGGPGGEPGGLEGGGGEFLQDSFSFVGGSCHVRALLKHVDATLTDALLRTCGGRGAALGAIVARELPAEDAVMPPNEERELLTALHARPRISIGLQRGRNALWTQPGGLQYAPPLR
jgi:hypothetical protein